MCSDEKVGDEAHILLSCTNNKLKSLRETFIICLKQIIQEVGKLNDESLFIYLLSCNDASCNELFIKYVENVLKCVPL